MPTIKDLTTALRSGKYKQGFGSLRSSEDEYCVLGVAIDLIDHECWEKGRTGYNYDGYSGVPVKFLMDTYGMSSSQIDWLVDLNDERKFNFNEIAEYVEQRF